MTADGDIGMMKRGSIAIVLLVLFGLPAGHAQKSAPPPLTVQFSENAITAANVSPGATVVLFGIARVGVGRPVAIQVKRWVEMVSDDDRDGAVRVEFPAGVPAQGIWAVVDMSSGAYAVVPTPGYDPPRIAFSSDLLKNDNAGQIRKVAWPLSEMELLVVRPGDGVWRLYAAKFGSFDDDRQNPAALRIDVDKLLPVGNSPARIGHIRNGDLIVIIDPDWMRYGVVEVGK